MKNLSLLFILFTFAFQASYSQSYEELKNQFLMEYPDNSMMGYKFIIAVPPNADPALSPRALEIYVTSAFDAQVTLSNYDGRNIVKKVSVGSSVVFSSLNNELDFGMEVREFERPSRKALTLKSNQPVSVYVLNRKENSSDGYMAYPVSTWGTEYRHLSAYDLKDDNKKYSSGFIILASQNNTLVNISLQGKGGNAGSTQMGKKIGDSWTVSLQEGEIYYVAGNAETASVFDLSGSLVTADKPIGLISCHEGVILPAKASDGISGGISHLSEMLPPVSSWGNEYATIEIDRETGKGDLFRITSSEDQMQARVVWSDLQSGSILGNWRPAFIKAGDVEEYLEIFVNGGLNHLNSISGASQFSSDSPFLPMQYSYSPAWDGNNDFRPFMTLFTPVEQYVTSANYHIPSFNVQSSHFVNIIALHDTNDLYFEDLRALKLDGVPIFQSYPDFISNRISYSHLYWIRIPSSPGAHSITSDRAVKFGGNIYGTINGESYGWQLASEAFNLQNIDNVKPYFVKTVPIPGAFDITAKDSAGFSKKLYIIQKYSDNFRQEIGSQGWGSKEIYQEFRFNLEVEDKSQDAIAVFAIKDINGNVAIDSVFYQAGTSVPELITESDELEIYPNPAQNTVLINIKTDYSAGDILLIGSTGKIHKNIAAAGEKNITLDIRDLPSGIYNINLKANGKLYSRKLSIIK